MPKIPERIPDILDKSGRKLSAGDLIVYGHALGRCAALQYGKVLEIRWSKPKYDFETAQPKVKVQGMYLPDNWDREDPPKLLKPSTLAFGSRILILSREQVEPRVLAILDEVKT